MQRLTFTSALKNSCSMNFGKTTVRGKSHVTHFTYWPVLHVLLIWVFFQVFFFFFEKKNIFILKHYFLLGSQIFKISHLRKGWSKFREQFNPFSINVPILHPPKTFLVRFSRHDYYQQSLYFKINVGKTKILTLP